MSLNLAFYSADGMTSASLSTSFRSVWTSVKGVAGNYRDLKFSSKLPGGDYELSFKYADRQSARFQEMEQPTALVVEVSDESGEVVFTGRLSRHRLQAEYSELTYVGFWQTLFKTVYAKPGDGFASVTTPSDVVRDILRTAAVQLARTEAYIQHNGVDAAASNNLTFKAFAYAGDVLGDLLKIPGAAGEQWVAYVDNERRLHYQPKRTTPNYLCSVDDLGQGWSLEQVDEEVYSSVFIEYTGTDGVRTQAKHYHREATQVYLKEDSAFPLILPDRKRYSESAIDMIAKLFLNEHSRRRQHTSNLVIESPTIRDADGNTVPSHRLRAGDVLRIVDLPIANDAADGSVDDLRSFHLIQVEYDANTRHVTLTPDNPPDTIQVLVNALGQSATK